MASEVCPRRWSVPIQTRGRLTMHQFLSIVLFVDRPAVWAAQILQPAHNRIHQPDERSRVLQKHPQPTPIQAEPCPNNFTKKTTKAELSPDSGLEFRFWGVGWSTPCDLLEKTSLLPWSRRTPREQ
eukprot:3554816-Amphidinium_carterae.1